MDSVKAFLGFAAIAALVLAPLVTIFAIGARSGKGKERNNSNWAKGLKISPAEFINSFTKIRPK